MANTFITGAKESTENVNSSRRVRDVSKKAHYLDPEVAPFTLLTNKSGRRTAKNSKHEWIEFTEAEKLDGLNDAGVTTGTTAVVVDNPTFWRAGNIGINLDSKERFLVTSISGSTLTVTRSIGDTAATNWTDNTDLAIIGTAYGEGADSPDERSHQETYVYNYTQIHRDSFGETGTQMASDNYFGDRKQLRADRLREHKVQIENALLFGDRDKLTTGAGSTAKPIRTSGGFVYFATSNAKSSIGTLTEPELEDWCEDVFSHVGGSGSRTLFVSPLAASALNQLAAGRLRTVNADSTYGIKITQFESIHGTLNIVKHRLLRSGAVGDDGYGGYMFAVEPSKTKFVTMPGRDTKLRENIETPGNDGWKDEWLTECGLEVANPELHGVASGITA